MRFFAALVLVSSTAAAAPIQIHDAGDGSLRAVQPVAPSSAAATAQTHTLYLNRHGGSVTPGNNNSLLNTSTLVSQASQIAGWDVTDADWAETVACVRQMWSTFDVEVTDEDPGETPHVEVHVGGTPAAIGFGASIGGVSPMAVDCSIVERSVVFVFPKNLGHRPQLVCEVIGQEVGHSFGLDHEIEPSDPMTYLPFSGDRTFRDKAVACGESSARPCGFPDFPVCRPSQNSFRILLDRLGAPGSDRTLPTIDVIEPHDGALVEPGFSVVATAQDNVGIERITLFVDGGMVAVDSEGLSMATDPNMPEGNHELLIQVIDTAGNIASSKLTVRVGTNESSSTPDFMPSMGCSSSSGNAGWLIALALVAGKRRWRRRR